MEGMAESEVVVDGPGTNHAPANEMEILPECTTRPTWKAIALLSAQHLSSAWNSRTMEFAAVLYLVTLFPGTLIPSALLGLFTSSVVAIFSGWAGSIVDRGERLATVRRSILGQKLSAGFIYGILLVLFVCLPEPSSQLFIQPAQSSQETAQRVLIGFLLGFIVAASAVLGLANVCMDVSVEREWVLAIAGEDSNLLTTLNTILRRVDLTCKLVAPLWVSLLTTYLSAIVSLSILLSLLLACFIFEYGWIRVVFRAFPQLSQARQTQASLPARGRQNRVQTWLNDWHDYSHMPVFLSSLSISCLYLTTLSFEGPLIAYLHNVRQWSNAYIGGMRGVSVVTGLMGTLAMPMLERFIGLIRAGNWSIWFEAASLAPVVATFWAGIHGTQFPTWNSAVLLSGVILSRIGLWSFDLVQLKLLQTSLAAHPRRNALTALQYSLQSLFGAAGYILTLVVADPEHFGVTAAVSFAAVLTGAVIYAEYVRRQRGHLFHFLAEK